MYVRKTNDEYQIQGFYGSVYGWETVTTEDNKVDARARLKEYRENETGVSFRLIKKRVSK